MEKEQGTLPFQQSAVLTVSNFLDLIFCFLIFKYDGRRLKVKNMFTASIFAYGQTSSGKTYTMGGITEYAVADICEYIDMVCSNLNILFYVIP
jgi:hypothetical protein